MDELKIALPQGIPPRIGLFSFALEDQRRRTLGFAAGVPEDALEWTPPGATNSTATLLYHLAATEMSWLYEDILGVSEFPPDVKALLPYPYRDDARNLFPVRGESLDELRERLAATRRILLDHVHALDPEDFLRERAFEKYVVTPEWILYHLLEHEAHHAGQIRLLGQLAEQR